MIMILTFSSMNSFFTHMNIYITKLYNILLLLLLFFIDTKVYLKLTRYQQTFEWQAFCRRWWWWWCKILCCRLLQPNELMYMLLVVDIYVLIEEKSEQETERETETEKKVNSSYVYIFIYIWNMNIYEAYIYMCAWVGRSI